jgi:microcystin-dependent protein
MARNYSSVASEKTLSADVNSTATSITLNNLTGLPNPPYVLVLNPDTSLEEAVLVNSVTSGTTLSVTRAIENNATASSHTTGNTVRHMIVGSDLQNANDHAVASTGVHGLAAGVAVVGDSSTQTLTNKTLTSPKINENVVLTATATELNVLDGITPTTAELNYVDGVTSPIQTQLNAKAASNAVVSSFNGVTGPVTGVSSLNGATGAITGVVKTSDTGTVTSTMIADLTIATGDIADSAITSAKIADDTIVNADINSAAAIAWSKMATDTNNVYTNPVGMLAPFAGATAPTGWLLCAGQAVSKTTYAALYTVIGANTYGTDTTSDFYLPDLRGRVPAGVDNMGGTDAGRLDWTNQLGGVGASSKTVDDGEQKHTLTTAEIPAHSHSLNVDSANGSVATTSGPGHLKANGASLGREGSPVTAISMSNAVAQNTGGGGAHNNMQPTILLNYIIKY